MYNVGVEREKRTNRTAYKFLLLVMEIYSGKHKHFVRLNLHVRYKGTYKKI